VQSSPFLLSSGDVDCPIFTEKITPVFIALVPSAPPRFPFSEGESADPNTQEPFAGAKPTRLRVSTEGATLHDEFSPGFVAFLFVLYDVF